MMKRISSFTLLLCCLSSLFLHAGDTLSKEINALDELGRKTGYWVIKASMKPTKGYSSDAVVEEGEFEANKRQGNWKRYYPDGTLKSEITYRNNIPNGPYSTYYPTGITEEQGNWAMNKNTGEFRRFHPNGKPAQEFIFDDNGVRNGNQRYFHENGALQMQVDIVNGREEGDMTRYYANGDIKEKKTFKEGQMEEGSLQRFEPVEPEAPKESIALEPVVKSKKVVEDKPNIQVFKATGENTLYNKLKLISQTGYFKNGRLWEGRWYRYNEDGILVAIEVYREGVLVGEAPLPE